MLINETVFKNNQGCINAKLTALFNNKQALIEYVETLTNKQKSIGKKHLETIKAIRNKKNNARNENMPKNR